MMRKGCDLGATILDTNVFGFHVMLSLSVDAKMIFWYNTI